MSRLPPYRRPFAVALVLAAAIAAGPAAAEEITLHDGQKIEGMIVGFENGMFRVETEFGFALVRKDKVKSISFGPAGAAKAEERKESRSAVTPVVVPPPPDAAVAPAKPPSPGTPAASEVRPAPLPPVSRPLNEPLPADIRGHLEGTTYVNDTFQFSFYKPPGWRIHDEAPRETGRAIVAIGSENDRTVLFVDRQVWSGTPNLKSEATEANLRTTYQEYQVLEESAIQLAGRPAVRRDFRGLLDGAEWRGISVRVAEGNTVFGLIGLTSAETLQFYQAVLGKIINSFHFLNSSQEAPVRR